MFCPQCGKSVPEGTQFCESCGAAASSAGQQGAQVPPGQYPPPQYQAPPPHYRAPPNGPPYGYSLPLKSAGIAALLAAVFGLFGFMGIGHIYVGKIVEGIIILIAGIAIWAIGGVVVLIFGIATMGIGLIAGIIVLAIIGLAFWAWQIFDAYNKANQYNSALQRTGRAPW